MAEKSLLARTRDRIAKRLWSGDVLDGSEPINSASASPRLVGSQWERTRVTKQDGSRRKGTVPKHINAPIEGRPRPFDPYSLRQLAKSEVVQGVVNTLTGDLDSIPWSVVPINDRVSVSDSTLQDAEAALHDLNPNPESFDDINSMFAVDCLEVGNCVGTTTTNIEGRRAEAVPLDPNTFTVDWNQNRILERFYQYPHAGESKWGDPIEYDRDEVIWGTYNPTTQRGGFYGRSPVDMIARTINIMGGLVEKEMAELEEGMPSGLIALKGDEWNQQNYQNFKTYWKEEVQGSQMKHPVAEGDAEFVPFNMTYKELQVLDRQQWYAKVVGAAFRVPVSETGLAIGESMTRATDVSQRQRYKQKALGALLRQLEDVWTYQYLHRWFSEDIKLTFDLGKDLMEKEILSGIRGTQLDHGTRTVNEVREEDGLDPVEWGEEPFLLKSYTAPDPVVSSADSEEADQQNTEQDNQQALDEGLQQEAAESPDTEQAQKRHVDSLGWDTDHGTWLPADYEVSTIKALRPEADDSAFYFDQDDINALQTDIEALWSRYIDDFLNQLKGNQQLLRFPAGDERGPNGFATVEKALPEFMTLIESTIGLAFAEETAEVLATHKATQIIEGEEAILDELQQAGVSTEEMDLAPTRDRVVERIQNRTLRITKPISNRLETALREVLVEGWQQGWRITKIEEQIRNLKAGWTGWQAERLARDQIGRAAKEGRLGYAKETGDEVGGWEMEWIDSSDHRVRDSHEAMDGETTPVGEPFIVDYSYDNGPSRVPEEYPGESKWGIQCRCGYKLSPMAPPSSE